MTRFTNVRGIVFDLDGTLIDSYDAIAESLNAALEAAGHTPLPVEEVRGMVGLGLETLVSKALGPEHVEEGVRNFRARYEEIFLERTTLMPRVAGTLDQLHRRGYRMSVASNKPSIFTWRILEGLKVRRYLTTVLGPDLVEKKKPHPEMVHRAMKEMGLDAARTLYVGDMEVDVQTARAAGVPVVVVPTGSRSEAELRAAVPDLLIPGIESLLDLLPGPSEGGEGGDLP
jgi:2-phosphoglycolate phosphatase